MREFKTSNQIFIKSKNTTNKIWNRYLYSLIPFILLFIIYNLIKGNTINIINLIKNFSISLLINTIVQYIFNIKSKNNKFIKIFKDDHIIIITIILSLFSVNSNIIIIIISSLITIVIKNILKNTYISSTTYGLLIIFLSNIINNIDTPLNNLSELSYVDTFTNILKPYGSIIDYLLGLNLYYLSPILSIIIFIYLFYKKSIKYNIVVSYITTFTIFMLFIGLFNNMNIWYALFQLTTGNILFLSVFCLPNYPNTPITTEGQVIYGIILGIITSILRFIIPELSVVITLIIGPLLLTKWINKISIKLKNNKKQYNNALLILVIITILAIFIINKII